MFQFLVEAALHIIHFILHWGMNVQNNDMTQQPLSIMYDIVSLKNSTHLTDDMIDQISKYQILMSYSLQ
jgi:hypothetical protein